MRNFYTSLDQLPKDSSVYFSHYHNLWFSKHPSATTGDLEAALSELRFAYRKYENKRFRIKEMADIIQSGINKFTKEEYKDKNPEPSQDFKDEVINSLF